MWSKRNNMYRIWNSQKTVDGNKALVPLREEDLLFIMEWRNSQMDILRTKKILTSEDQKNYFYNIVAKDFDSTEPRQILVSYLEDGKCMGYGGLTYIDWPSLRAEVSFLMQTALSRDHARYQQYFAEYLQLLKQLSFHELPLRRLFTETSDIRPWHIEVLSKCGFRFEGRLRSHVRIGENYVDSLLHGCLRSDEVAT